MEGEGRIFKGTSVGGVKQMTEAIKVIFLNEEKTSKQILYQTEPHCSLCRKRLNEGDSASMCEISRLIFCTDCSSHKKLLCIHTHYKNIKEHIDFRGILTKRK